MPEIPDNLDEFIENIQIKDIYQEWKDAWVAIEEVKENMYKVFRQKEHSVITKFRKHYDIISILSYAIVYDGVYIWGMSEYIYIPGSIWEKRLGWRGLALFNDFQNKWLGTLITILWLQYLQEQRNITELYTSCDVDNIAWLAHAKNFGLRIPENDYRWLEWDMKERFVFRLALSNFRWNITEILQSKIQV